MTNNAIDSNIPIEISKGGTGNSVLTTNSVLVGNGTSPITPLAVGATNTALIGNTGADPVFATVSPATITNGSNGQILIGGGSGLSWQNITAGSNITLTPGSNSLTIASSVTNTSSGASTVSFFAYLTTDRANIFGDGMSINPIPADGVLYNVGSGYNSSQFFFTAPVTGYYCFAVIFAGTPSGNTTSANILLRCTRDPFGSTTRFYTYMTGYSLTDFGTNGAYLSPNSGLAEYQVCGYVEISLVAGDTCDIAVVGKKNAGNFNNAGIKGKSGSTYYTCVMGALL